MTLTPEQRDELRALAEKATPGPWRADECLPASPGQFAVVTPREENAPYAAQPAQYVTPWGLTGTDAALIAAMRNALPALLDALDAAEAEVDRLHSWAGLMELLDEHYPADLIPTATDDPARDAGPRIVSLIRRVDAAEAARDTAERQVRAVRGALAQEPTDAEVEAKIQADTDSLAAEIHEAVEFQYDQCDHGTYHGGHMHGEPYQMCRINAERIMRRRAARRDEEKRDD